MGQSDQACRHQAGVIQGGNAFSAVNHETSPPKISASGSGRYAAPDRLAHCNGANLPSRQVWGTREGAEVHAHRMIDRWFQPKSGQRNKQMKEYAKLIGKIICGGRKVLLTRRTKPARLAVERGGGRFRRPSLPDRNKGGCLSRPTRHTPSISMI